MSNVIKGFQFGGFQLDLERRVLLRGVEVVDFGAKTDVWDFLVYLATHSRQPLPEKQILEQFWPEHADFEVKINRLKNLFYRLRQIFPEAGECFIWRGHLIKWIVPVLPLLLEALPPPTAKTIPSQGNSLVEAHAPDSVELKRPFLTKSLIGIWVVAALIAILVLAVWGIVPTNGPRKDSIAVLPFKDENSVTLDALADGITEQVINRLTRVHNLKVTARSTAFAYKDKDQDPRKVGSELGVRTVLEGHVRQVDDHVNVQVDLVNAADGTQIWGAHFEYKLQEIQEIPAKIATAVASQMRIDMNQQDVRRVAKHMTVDAEAYELCLRGRQAIGDLTPDRVRQSKDLFEQAIGRDPGYALAYAGLADSYNYLGLLELEAPRDVMPLAKEAAKRAIALDSETAEAYTALGIVQSTYEWDWIGSGKQFQRALDLNPGGAYEQHWYGHFLESIGRWIDAENQMQRAVALDPLNPMPNECLDYDFVANGHYDRALQQSRQLIEISPDDSLPHVLLALALEAKGLRDESLMENDRALKLSTESIWATGFIGGIYGRLGEPEKAQKILGDITQKGKIRYVSPLESAMLYFALGKKDTGFEFLNRAVLDRSVNLQYYVADKVFDSVRSDPRLTVIKEKLRLNDAAWSFGKR